MAGTSLPKSRGAILLILVSIVSLVNAQAPIPAPAPGPAASAPSPLLAPSAKTTVSPLETSADAPAGTIQGYNFSGFMDTNSYYGPYTNIATDTNATVEPNMNSGLAPPGCNAFNRFAIANYTGNLTCQLPGQVASAEALPCVDLTNKIVLITGASAGIGRASADRLAAAGATVIGTSRYPWRYPTPPNWQLFQLDQTSDDSVKQLINHVAAAYGRIDFLYLNAGRQFIGDTPNSDIRQMQLIVETNFWGPLRVLQAALPLMPTSGYARILMTSSVESLYGAPGYLPYTVSKWAIRALQESWAATQSASGPSASNIPLITIMPSTVNTSLGYTAIYGCPQLASDVGDLVINQYKTQGLNPHDVGEAVYRIAIDPAPRLQYLIMRDDQWQQIIPLICRRETLPLEQVYVNTPAGANISAWLSSEASSHAKYTCNTTCPGAQFCGAGPLGSGTLGTGTIGPY